MPVGTVVKDADGDDARRHDRAGHALRRRPRRPAAGSATRPSPPRSARPPGSRCSAPPGWEGDVLLELKTVADVALVGFPSAGKSSLIAAMSAARPKIADYPFTTLHPNLGVVEAGDVRYTVADVPGLIEGASEGKGLGLEFLRHVERCTALVHVLDCATLEPGRDPLTDLDIILGELAAYPVPEGQVPLLERPQLDRAQQDRRARGRGPRRAWSAPTSRRAATACSRSRPSSHEGLRQLQLRPGRHRRAPTAPRRRGRARRSRASSSARSGRRGGLRRARRGRHVRQPSTASSATKPERWVQQTDFQNDEAVGFLADRLAKLGVEDELFKAGADRRARPSSSARATASSSTGSRR